MSDALQFVVDVPADPRWFDAHFPGQPLVPGVVLLAALEAGCRDALGGLGLGTLEAVRHLRFLQPVQAPQRLQAAVQVRGEWLHCALAMRVPGDSEVMVDVLRAQLRFAAAAALPAAP